MAQSLIQRTFAGGELAPVLAARADIAKFISGLRTCRNFFVRREGGASNRAGLRFVTPAKTATAGTRLMRFVPPTGDGYLVEMGAGYFRFFRDGAPIVVSAVPAWSAIVNYVPGDLVVVAGVNYYCFLANLNQTPPNGAFWYALTGAIYEVPTPYSLAHLPTWNQSGSVITLTEHTVTPKELIFVSSTRWVLQDVVTTPVSAPPTALASFGNNAVPAWSALVNYVPGAIVTSGGNLYACIQANINQVPPNAVFWTAMAATALDRIYVVTSLLAGTFEESAVSATTTVTGKLAPTIELPNSLTWTPPVGLTVDSYNVYVDPYGNGVFGFIANTANAALFIDPGTPPDFAQQPPTPVLLFQNVNTMPSCSANYQQRRIFANSDLEPDRLDGSRTGFRSNFGVSTPIQDDDAFTFRLAGNNQAPIRWMVGLKPGLIIGTDAGEWSMTGGGGPQTPITPSSVNALQETYNGVSPIVRPAPVGNAIIYVQVRGNVVRDVAFDQGVALGLAGRDLTNYATHLFETSTIVAMDYAQVPDSIVWAVRSDGILLGMTYILDQQIVGWHRHDTDGLFEDICVVPEGNRDAPYVLVSRTVGGVTVRYIERLETRVLRPGFFNTDAFFVDAGLTYSGAPVASVSGLGHLEGRIVAVVGDGSVIFDGDPSDPLAPSFTVTGGVINLPAPTRSVVHVGLPIRFADLESLDIDVQGAAIRDKQKAVHATTLLLDNSSPHFQAGPDVPGLIDYDPTGEPWKTATGAQTGQYEIQIPTNYTPYGRVFVRQTQPLPLTILAFIPSAELGG
jgi:hypothetical protein